MFPVFSLHANVVLVLSASIFLAERSLCTSPGGGGGTPRMKGVGMLVVSLKGVLILGFGLT